MALAELYIVLNQTGPFSIEGGNVMEDDAVVYEADLHHPYQAKIITGLLNMYPWATWEDIADDVLRLEAECMKIPHLLVKD